jgi:hypothetical protein
VTLIFGPAGAGAELPELLPVELLPELLIAPPRATFAPLVTVGTPIGALPAATVEVFGVFDCVPDDAPGFTADLPSSR